MSSPFADYERTGLDKMIKLAKTLCRLVLDFEVIIRAVFPDSVPINALLTAIKDLCALIPEAETDFLQWETNTALPPADPSGVAGINPDAPAAVPPDFV